MRIVFDSRDHKVRIGFDAVFKRNGDINESTGHSRAPGAKSLANFAKGFHNPIRDVVTSSGHVIRADVLDTTLGCIKYLQLALRTAPCVTRKGTLRRSRWPTRDTLGAK